MKYALIIGNNEYSDPKLSQLKTPDVDARALAKVLRNKRIGNFEEVTILVNKSEAKSRRVISQFLSPKKPDDMVLVYFSGHGVLDGRGNLFLALKDTEIGSLNATAISSSFLSYELDNCRSRKQILILDCCNSGAFARGTKGEQKAITEATFGGNGSGRIVLTASDSTQFALEGDQVIANTELSLFTHFLLEGLETGEADINNDGNISLDEWYDYTYTKITFLTPRQVPHKWNYNQQGELVIAQNPFWKKPKENISSGNFHQEVKDEVIHKAVRDFEELLRSRATESEVGSKVVKLKKDFDVSLIDWEFNKSIYTSLDDFIAAAKNTWANLEIESLYKTIKTMADIMGGSKNFVRNLGGVTIRKADIGSHGAEAFSHHINLSAKGALSAWAIVHEFAHAWDANYQWRLSSQLEIYTGGYTNKLLSILKMLVGKRDVGFLKSEEQPGRRGRLPGCNAFGYFYGDKPSGSNWGFNRREDFAEAVAMYIGWDQNNSLSNQAHGRIERFLLPNGAKDNFFGQVDNWTDYKQYFYPANGDYKKTKRWHFVDKLVNDKLGNV
jgi:hypothetical protein